jgi:hypothetical protein
MISEIAWFDEPAVQTYMEAEKFLSLLVPQPEGYSAIQGLYRVPVVGYRVSDIMRAAKLDRSYFREETVRDFIEKIDAGEPLSPILIVRINRLPVVVDGYHRLMAVYESSETATIRCKIV